VTKALRRPQFRFGLLVLLPIVAWYILFAFRPLVSAFRMAMIDYKLLDPASSPFVGLRHFRTILSGYELFWKAGANTLLYAVMIVAGTLPFALGFAYCLTNVLRGRNLYQWALFLPVVVSMASIALLFRFLMDQGGILNHALKAIGLPPSKWLAGIDSALPSVALVALWKGLGGNIVILAAGLLGIPEELYDAARVDGASAWATFWRITLPLLSHTLKLVVILVTIGSLQAYTSIVILTRGGPARATYMISQFVVEEAFSAFRFGLASAASFALFAAILAVTLLQIRALRTEWEY
jgi:ABC-type sugar transport system permease subunit